MTTAEIEAEIIATREKLDALRELHQLRTQMYVIEGEQTPLEKLNHLIRVVCKRRKLKREVLISHDRRQLMCEARFIVWYLAQQHIRITTIALGKAFHRDHAAICSGRQRMADWMESTPRLRAEVLEIEKLFLNACGESA